MSDITRTVVLPGGTRALTLREVSLTLNGVTRRFGRRRITMGAHPDNDVVLDDAMASRQHAVVEADERGYRLVDRGSKNGTFLGRNRVADAYLVPGDIFRIGNTPITFGVTDREVEVRVSEKTRFGNLLGESLAMREVFGMLEKVAPTDATVLVEGASGTGKELVAEAIHEHSARKDGPFVVFDCSAVSSELIESELFGHVKGAFTGAVAGRRGAFEEAKGGTLFIDELGELDLELQPKLLRALEKRQIKRVGSNEVISIDVRIVAATNRNLAREVETGGFREDLFYRLAVVQLYLPPLSERPEDVPVLVEHFLEDVRERSGQEKLSLSYSTMERLKQHPWNGNIRELRNFVERAAVFASDSGHVETRFLFPKVAGRVEARDAAEDPKLGDWLALAGAGDDTEFKEIKRLLVDRFERAYWEGVLERTEGNVSAAARLSGLHRKSVEYILKKLDLR